MSHWSRHAHHIGRNNGTSENAARKFNIATWPFNPGVLCVEVNRRFWSLYVAELDPNTLHKCAQKTNSDNGENLEESKMSKSRFPKTGVGSSLEVSSIGWLLTDCEWDHSTVDLPSIPSESVEPEDDGENEWNTKRVFPPYDSGLSRTSNVHILSNKPRM